MVIHRESSHLSRLKWKLVSAQHVMFSCFRQHCQFMEMKLVLNSQFEFRKLTLFLIVVL